MKVKLGDTASVEVDAYIDRKFSGTVVEVANSASDISSSSLTSDKVTNFIVKVRLDNNSFKDLLKNNNSFPFRPGMSATVDIFTNSKSNVISVPIQAVTTRPKEKTKDDTSNPDDLNEVVFTISEDTAKMLVVNTGIQDDEYIEILNGINTDEIVITGPYNILSKDLKQGDKVKIQDKKDK
ncbi:MAG: efflux RND transporter periplasmic adaptor subunit [Saprospiraceae bacterium]